MEITEFEQILGRPESSTLDFKRQQYDFSNDNEGRKTAEFLKDIVSFCNTIRSESSFIIVGVDAKADGSKELVGLNTHIDDSIFQQKVKNKAIPIPEFSYRTIRYQNLSFGIFEFPVRKYSNPITVTQKLKGLDPGDFYFRRNSSNSKANGFETISISKWLESLPATSITTDLLDEISETIKHLTNKNRLLSESLSECLKIASKFGLEDLKGFCVNELRGWVGKLSSEEIEPTYSFRTCDVIFTAAKLNLPNYLGWDARRMILELKKYEGVYETRMFFPYSVPEIEEHLYKLSESKNMLLIQSMAGRNFIDDPKFENVEMTVIMHKDNLDSVYLNIRQKLIDKLISVH